MKPCWKTSVQPLGHHCAGSQSRMPE